MKEFLRWAFTVHPVLTVILIYVLITFAFALAGTGFAEASGLAALFTLGGVAVGYQTYVSEAHA